MSSFLRYYTDFKQATEEVIGHSIGKVIGHFPIIYQVSFIIKTLLNRYLGFCLVVIGQSYRTFYQTK